MNFDAFDVEVSDDLLFAQISVTIAFSLAGLFVCFFFLIRLDRQTTRELKPIFLNGLLAIFGFICLVVKATSKIILLTVADVLPVYIVYHWSLDLATWSGFPAISTITYSIFTSCTSHCEQKSTNLTLKISMCSTCVLVFIGVTLQVVLCATFGTIKYRSIAWFSLIAGGVLSVSIAIASTVILCRTLSRIQADPKKARLSVFITSVFGLLILMWTPVWSELAVTDLSSSLPYPLPHRNRYTRMVLCMETIQIPAGFLLTIPIFIHLRNSLKRANVRSLASRHSPIGSALFSTDQIRDGRKKRACVHSSLLDCDGSMACDIQSQRPRSSSPRTATIFPVTRDFPNDAHVGTHKHVRVKSDLNQKKNEGRSESDGCGNGEREAPPFCAVAEATRTCG